MTSGRALEKFKEMITNQGGDASVVDQPERLVTAKYQIELPAKEAGVVTKLVANEIGVAAMLLGAGRQTKEDTINYGVGLKLHKKIGDAVAVGESLVTIYADSKEVTEVKERLYKNIVIGASAVEPPLIHDIITE